MIPKPDSLKPAMMSVGDAEALIDASITAIISGKHAMIDASPSANLVPISTEALEVIKSKYAAGGWTVRVAPLRTPDGYAVTLS